MRAARGLMQTQLLLFIVGLVADAGVPGLVRVEPVVSAASPASSAVAGGFLVCARGITVVPVLELAQLGVEPAADAGGRGAWVVCGGRVAREGVERGRWQAELVGLDARVGYPAAVAAEREEDEDYEEDDAAVHDGDGLG